MRAKLFKSCPIIKLELKTGKPERSAVLWRQRPLNWAPGLCQCKLCLRKFTQVAKGRKFHANSEFTCYQLVSTCVGWPNGEVLASTKVNASPSESSKWMQVGGHWNASWRQVESLLGLKEALSLLILCALGNRRRPFSYHTKMADFEYSCVLSAFS